MGILAKKKVPQQASRCHPNPKGFEGFLGKLGAGGTIDIYGVAVAKPHARSGEAMVNACHDLQALLVFVFSVLVPSHFVFGSLLVPRSPFFSPPPVLAANLAPKSPPTTRPRAKMV